MTTKPKPEENRPAQKAAADATADQSGANRKAADERAARVERRECVVDDGRPHVGRATPGAVICSAHAISHHPDGTPRGA